MTRMCKTVSQRLGVEMLARAALLSLAREKVQRSSRKKLSPRQTCKNETILASLGIMGGLIEDLWDHHCVYRIEGFKVLQSGRNACREMLASRTADCEFFKSELNTGMPARITITCVYV